MAFEYTPLFFAHNLTARNVNLKSSILSLGNELHIALVTRHPFKLSIHFSQQFFNILSSSKLKLSSIDLKLTQATRISIGIPF